MATTGMCDSFKVELLQAGHCLSATSSQTGTTHATTTLDTLTSTANISRGMSVTGTNIAANTFVADILSATSVLLSITASGSAANTMTFTGDALKMLLVKGPTPTRTFDHTQTNVGTPGSGSPTATNVGTDEASGTGYTTGGNLLTISTGPALAAPSNTTATIQFSNTSWTTATFQATAGIIYNTYTGSTNARIGAAATPIVGRTISVHDFGGNQQVSAGTFTVVMPTNDSNNAILRVA